jgi:NAD(P)H-dependent FMN reductase
MSPVRTLILNGSLRGPDGNTGWLLDHAAERLAARGPVDVLHLADPLPDLDALAERLRVADALLVGTGVYWQSWGSPLQRFLEVFTPHENTDLFFGKPVGCVVTMDSVGGSELAARLVAVFTALGCLVPPCTTLVVSRVALEATGRVRPLTIADPNDDVWSLEDLDVVLHNLVAGTRAGDRAWRPWGVRSLVAPVGPYPATGRLDLGSPRFLPPPEPGGG